MGPSEAQLKAAREVRPALHDNGRTGLLRAEDDFDVTSIGGNGSVHDSAHYCSEN